MRNEYSDVGEEPESIIKNEKRKGVAVVLKLQSFVTEAPSFFLSVFFGSQMHLIV